MSVSDQAPAATTALTAQVCAVASGAAFIGLVSVASLSAAPNELQRDALVAFASAAPIGLGAWLMGRFGDPSDVDGWLDAVLGLAALATLAGLAFGVAALASEVLGRGSASAPSWPFILNGLAWLASVAAFWRRHASSRAERAHAGADADDRDTAYGPVQLVTDNTAALRRRARARATIKERLRINPEADFEMRDWSRKYACTPEQLKEAVRAVGTIAADVEAYLARRH